MKAIELQGYENPTKIQRKVIPIINNGIDVIAASKSGTGKTASFVLPMLDKISKMIKPSNRVLRGLIIVPTRELVDQISVALDDYGKFLKVRHTKIQGGISRGMQVGKLSTGIDIVIATPGRLKDMIKEEIIDLSSINMIVLDEADTMLELGFLEEIEYIFAHCARKRQIMMFSATISQNIKKLGKKFLLNPVSVEVSNRRDVVNLIDHKAIKIDKKRKNELLAHIIKTDEYQQILVFVNMKETANSVLAYLKSQGINAVGLHGDIIYKERTINIKKFRANKAKVLVATDIAGRGIDIKELSLVINYELPEETDEFTHRVGRTGRANVKGCVITLLTTSDYNKFTKIERNLKLSIKRETLEEFELKDRQPRQKQMKKKSLSERKGLKKPKRKDENSGKKRSSKTTKRDTNRVFRKI
jgi:ATP-dependent RNA helicase RhlE